MKTGFAKKFYVVFINFFPMEDAVIITLTKPSIIFICFNPLSASVALVEKPVSWLA